MHRSILTDALVFALNPSALALSCVRANEALRSQLADVMRHGAEAAAFARADRLAPDPALPLSTQLDQCLARMAGLAAQLQAAEVARTTAEHKSEVCVCMCMCVCFAV
jgi:hypothetical protein